MSSPRILPIDKSLRPAIVTNVGPNYVECSFTDKLGENPFKCPMPHPYAGRGGGILIGIEKNTQVMVSNASGERWFIVAILPDMDFMFDVNGTAGIRVGETPYPKLKEGEVCIKGNPGQKLHMLKNGNIAFDAKIGDKSYDLELSKKCQGMFVRTNNVYSFTEAGRSIHGIVKRDVNREEDPNETRTTDFLSGESYERMLKQIGRSPQNDVQGRTTTLFNVPVVRNPALVEKRDLVYEFGDSFNVRGFDFEEKAMKSIQSGSDVEIKSAIESLRRDPGIRENRRIDVLDLNQYNYNHLIETVQGTLVDIYGNVLDINRNAINIPEAHTVIEKEGREGLKRVYDHLRRSVKYHFEINSRKDAKDTNPPDPVIDEIPQDRLKAHSRFSIDIDAEGLTKVNIPATSETGNIPLLGRHVVSREKKDNAVVDNGAFKNEEQGKLVDVKFAQIGAEDAEGGGFAGQGIVDTSYLPKSTNNTPITVGTAYHDLFDLAGSIFRNGRNKNPNLDLSEAILPLSAEINNRIPEIGENTNESGQVPNAGGKSVHLNLDGSVEASIGADTLDRKSMVLDLAGGILAAVGRDKNGRSIVAQTDGYILLQVGGKNASDPRFNNDNGIDAPGRFEIHFNRPGSPIGPSKIIVDEYGITISSAGRMLFESQGQMILSSKSDLLLNAKNIKQFGSYDATDRSITGAETLITRKGRMT